MPDANAPFSDHAEVYRQVNARFINMNDTLYKIPPLFATVIGGLWYFAIQHLSDQRWVAAGIFLFAAMVSITGGLLVMLRIEPRITEYHEAMAGFDGAIILAARTTYATAQGRTARQHRRHPGHSTTIIGGLMLGAGLISVAGALLPELGLLAPPPAPPRCCLAAPAPPP